MIKCFKLFILFFTLFVQSSFAQQTKNKAATEDNKQVQFPDASQYSNSKFTYKIISAANHTYCYDIFANGRLMIHQPSAPGLPGNEGFKTKSAAEKVAKLVIEKMKRGEMPPSVTKEEMEKLNVL